jgi:alkylation response protein AidB-like acyl-CoA dehydrogenase
MLVPADVGGGEAEPAELIEAVAALAEGDGSAGWCLAVSATSGMLGAYVPKQAAAEMFGAPGSIAGGVFAPKGKAVPAGGGDEGGDGGGYSATGRWSFASGCEHCDWLMGGCFVEQDGELRKLESGAPDIRLLLFPRDEVEIIDTWHVAGLRGTGSNDIAVDGALVSADRTASLISDSPRVDGPLYAFPVFGLLALSIAACGLGIARAAINDLTELAGAKKPSGSGRTLGERGETRSGVADAEAKARSARALIDEAVGEAWGSAVAGGEIPVMQRAALRLAASHGMRSARDAVDSMYELGGGSSVYESSPLQRRLRDVHVATQHMLVGPATWELAGRVLLGQKTDTSQL